MLKIAKQLTQQTLFGGFKTQLVASQSLKQQSLRYKFSSQNEEEEQEIQDGETNIAENLEVNEGENPEGTASENEGGPGGSKIEDNRNLVFGQQERVNILQQEFQVLQNRMPVRIFDTISNISKSSTNKDIRNMGQSDQQKYLRSRIVNILKKEGELSPHDIAYQLQEWIQESFQNDYYQILAEKDFKQIIFNPEFKHIIHLFFNKNFFTHNPNLISNQEVAAIVQRCTENSSLCYLLEFVKYHKKFLEKNSHYSNNLQSKSQKMQFGDQQILVEFLQSLQKRSYNSSDLADFDILSIFYHFQQLHPSNIMATLSVEPLIREFGNVVFGQAWKKHEKENFKNHLHDLLFINYQASLNNSIKYFLCDIFFSQESYQKALSSFSFIVLIFARLQQKSNNISDILHQFKQTMGQQSFDFYLVEHLPKILEAFSNKEKHSLYKQGLKLYLQQLQNGVTKFHFTETTFFDQQFVAKGKYNSKLFYNFEEVYKTELLYYQVNQESVGNILVEEQQQFQKYENRLFEKYASFIEDDKVELLKYLQQNNKYNGRLQILFDSQVLEKNKNNEKFLDSLLAESYRLIADSLHYETQNMKKFLEKKNLPYHNSPKYAFSSQQKKVEQTNLKVNEQINSLYFQNIFSKPYYINNKNITKMTFTPIKYSFSTVFKPLDNFNDEELMKNDLETNNEPEKPTQNTSQKGKGFKDYMSKVKEVDRNKINFESIKDLQNKDAQKQGKKDMSGDLSQAGQQLKELEQDQEQSIQIQKQVTVFTEEIDNPVDAQYFQNFFINQSDLDSMTLLQKHFLENENNTNKHGILNSLLKQKQIVLDSQNYEFHGPSILFKLFHQPSIFSVSSMPNPVAALMADPKSASKLVIEKSEENELEENIDFSSYLSQTIFPYALSEKSLNSLLATTGKQFSRKQLKRLLSHIVLFSSEIRDSNIQSIVDICVDQRLPFTLYEFMELVIKNEIKISQDSLKYVIKGLCNFKEMQMNCQILNKQATEQYKWEPTISILEPYIVLLLKYQESDKVFQVFNYLRKLIFSKKVPYNNNLTSEQNIQLQEAQKNKNRARALILYRNSLEFLNSNKYFDTAKLIFADMVNMKYELQQVDYILGIKANQASKEEVQKLYDEARKDPKLNLDEEFLECIFSVISYNIKDYQEFFEQVQKDLIFSEKIAFGPKIVNMSINIYSKTKVYTQFGNFLKFILKNCNRTNNTTKMLAYRIVNESTEELSKGYLKGILVDLFSPEQFQKMREKEQKEWKEQLEAGIKPVKKPIQNRQRERRQGEQQGDQQIQQNKMTDKQFDHQKKPENRNKEQYKRNNNQQQPEKQNERQAQKQEHFNIDITGNTVEENYSELSFAKKNKDKESKILDNLIQSKEKRKFFKNQGDHKFSTTVEYLETGVEK